MNETLGVVQFYMKYTIFNSDKLSTYSVPRVMVYSVNEESRSQDSKMKEIMNKTCCLDVPPNI